MPSNIHVYVTHIEMRRLILFWNNFDHAKARLKLLTSASAFSSIFASKWNSFAKSSSAVKLQTDYGSNFHCGQSRVRDTIPVSNSTVRVSKKSFCVLWHNLCVYLCSVFFCHKTIWILPWHFLGILSRLTHNNLAVFTKLGQERTLFSRIGYKDLE